MSSEALLPDALELQEEDDEFDDNDVLPTVHLVGQVGSYEFDEFIGDVLNRRVQLVGELAGA